MTDPGISVVSLSAVEFFGSGNCLMLLHLATYDQCFVVRSENKIHIVNIAYRLQLKYIRVMKSDFTKTKPPKIIKRE